MTKITWRILYGFIFLIAVVFCLRQVHEPDLWWQLRTGEYILESGEVPDADVFSFSYEGQPWVNVKWGFEVIQALTVKLFGAEFLFLPQVLANLLILFFLLKSMNASEGLKDSHLAKITYLFSFF